MAGLEFASEAHLKDWLAAAYKNYGNLYAHSLWQGGVRTVSELASSSHEGLKEAGVSNRIHADYIKACECWLQ